MIFIINYCENADCATDAGTVQEGELLLALQAPPLLPSPLGNGRTGQQASATDSQHAHRAQEGDGYSTEEGSYRNSE